MRTTIRGLTFALTFAMVAAACTSSSPSTAAPTTTEFAGIEPDVVVDEPEPVSPTAPIYSSLLLDTPGQAASSLIEAYADRDFLRALMIYDQPAQQHLFRALNNLGLLDLRREAFLLPENLIAGSGEHAISNSHALLARFLDDAAKTDALIVDFAGAEVQRSEIATADDGASIATVNVRLANNNTALLRLTVSDAGRWRVNQVAIDGVDFNDSGRVFVDASCGANRVRVYDGAKCPSTESLDAGIQDEIDRITEAAGDDTNKQVAAAQQIQDLVNRARRDSDDGICAALQGNAVLSEVVVSNDTLAKAEVLLETTCPGSLALLTEPADIPLSGRVLDTTRYGQLDLATPTASVDTFSDLFANEAFVLLFHALDREAQRRLADAAGSLDVSVIARPQVLDTWPGLGSSEHIDTPVILFSELWSEASATDQHLLDLSGPMTIVSTTSATFETPIESLEPTIDVEIVEAVSPRGQTLFFAMVESPSGRWRVRQVAANVDALGAPESADQVFIPET